MKDSLKWRRTAAFGLAVAAMLIAALLCLLMRSYPLMIGYPAESPESVGGTFFTINTALQMYRVDHGRYPTTEEGLKVLVMRNVGSYSVLEGPYLSSRLLVDPWGNPFLYTCSSPENYGSFELVSLGPDGIASDDDLRFPQE